jgi:hypothetical protein
MSPITLQVPDELAQRLLNQQDRILEILELGLRELNAEAQQGFPGAAELLEFLATLPSPQEILDLRPSESLQQRVRELLERSHAGTLTTLEEQEWEGYQYLEHLVRLAKAKACSKLSLPGRDA